MGEKIGFIHLKRQFRHDNFGISFFFNNFRARPHHDSAFAGRVYLPDVVQIENLSAGRKIRPLDEFHQFLN